MRVYLKTNNADYAGLLKKAKKKSPIAYKMLTKATVTDVNFKLRSELRNDILARRSRCKRYPENPEANWGPKARAEGSHQLQTHRKGGGTCIRAYIFFCSFSFFCYHGNSDYFLSCIYGMNTIYTIH